ncbi:sensor histidine kinase [Paenibacillus sp. GCM10027626]|uniref:sensor histidine kinase n=1 Tax=Paenibacillus sp. GCM10027626 TaxID=3273411 RepID=UPI0036346AFB
MRAKFNLKTYLFLFSLFLVTLSLVLISSVSYRISVSAVLDQTKKMDESNLKQVNNQIVYAIGEIEKVTRNLAGNGELLAKLDAYKASGTIYSKMKAERDLRNVLNELKVGYEQIVRIELFTPAGSVSSDIEALPAIEYSGSDVYRKIRNEQTNVHLFAPGTRDVLFGQKLPNFTFGTLLLDGGAEQGLMFVVMSPVWIDRMFRDEKVLIASRSGVVWSSDTELGENVRIADNLAFEQGDFILRPGKNEMQFFYMKSRYNDWYNMTFRSLEDIYGPIENIRNNVFGAVIVSSLISFVLVISVARNIVRPLHRLKRSAQKYRAQDIFEYTFKNGRSMGMRKIVMLYFVLIVTIPMSAYILMFHYFSSHVVENKVKASIVQTFAQTASNIDAFIATNERISTNIMTDPNVQRFLAAQFVPNAEPSRLHERIGITIDTNLALGNDIFETSLFDSSYRQLFSTSYFTNRELLGERAGAYAGQPLWFGYDVDKYNRNVIRLIRKVRSIREDGSFLQPLGYLQTTYYETNVESLYREVNVPGNVYIVDAEGTIISHSSKSLIGTKADIRVPEQLGRAEARIRSNAGRTRLVVTAECKRIPWMVVGEIDDKIVKSDSAKILASNLYTMALIAAAVLLVAHALAGRLTRSIVQLRRKLRLFGDGHVQVRFYEQTNINEIDELALAFQDMASRIRELIDSIYRSVAKEKSLEHEKKEAELIALQAQINPHFLYNTLESIKWMVKGGKTEQADHMISALAKLFRLGIQRENRLIPIDRELRYTRAYIDIQKVRLGDKVHFWWSVDQSLLSCLMPKLMLQPIIENAIVHGIHNKEEGNISIYCYEQDDAVVFKVIDDGVGLKSDGAVDVEQLKHHASSTGIGLYNVHRRIKLYYGDNYGVTMESKRNQGTRVTIVIPKVTEEQPKA